MGTSDSGVPPRDNGELDAPRRVFEKIALRRGSLRGLGQRCGRSTMWIWRQLRQNKGLDLVKTGQVLDQLGVPVRFFYEEVLAETSEYDPVWLLDYCREGNGTSRDPFLSELSFRFGQLARHSQVHRQAERRRRAEIDHLEQSSLQNREQAKLRLESLGREMLVSAEAAAAGDLGLSHGQVADCAHLLLVWGFAQRARGRRDDCVDSYVLAYRLAMAAGDTRIIGIFYHYGSHLLGELGQAAQALRFAEQACRLFQKRRDRSWLSRAFVHVGIALSDLGRHSEARIEALAALRLAPRRHWRTRTSAWLLVAHAALETGKSRRALGPIKRAKRHARADYLKAHVHWREGAVLVRLRQTDEAVLAFREAISLFERSGQPLDVAFVAVDLAEAMMIAGRFAEARVLSRDLVPHFEALKNNAQAFALWLDLCALILAGAKSETLAQVGQIRQALRKADPKVRSDGA